MFGESKYSNILTVLLVIVIVVIICLLIFLGIDVYNQYYSTKETSEGVAQFNNRVDNAPIIQMGQAQTLKPSTI